jgi:uncharacterized LabA/DUF88 family protein
VCGRGFLHSPEKKVDVALATDLVRSSLRGKIDVACLVSADADFVPAVQAARDTGVAVVGVLWENQESSLAGCCSAVVRVSVDDMEQHGVANRP